MCMHTLPVCIYTTYVWVPAETHFSLREVFSFVHPLRKCWDLQYSHRLLMQYEILVSFPCWNTWSEEHTVCGISMKFMSITYYFFSLVNVKVQQFALQTEIREKAEDFQFPLRFCIKARRRFRNLLSKEQNVYWAWWSMSEVQAYGRTKHDSQ